ncbi:hypothetical protein [Cognatiluteimonas profundi]|uniref:hypothetical protein n=1 Tax=Cognatiluteimonas profundi TaxID=2594501 RepID=UPI00131AADE2|nr:hypothetical protein [Lysobacter profundi]
MNSRYVGYLMSLIPMAALGPVAAQEVVAPSSAAQSQSAPESTIQVTRDVGAMGKLCLGEIYLDGKVVAELDRGQSYSTKVSPGSHTLRGAPALNTWLCKRFYSAPQMQQAQLTIDVPVGANLAYRYGFTSSGVPSLTAAGP